MRSFISLILIVMIGWSNLSACNSNISPSLPSTQAAQNYWPTNGWHTSTPEDQGMSSEKLAQMLAQIQSDGMRIHSMLIVRHGYLVLEAYFDPYRPEMKHQIASVTKSVIGSLTGIAIEQGFIKGIQQKVVESFPERKIAQMDEKKKAITLENLLSLTSGLDCEDFGSGPTMEQSMDWVQFALDLPMRSQPGSEFRYCSAPVHLLSAILQNSTGQTARDYANQVLFRPLGIPEVSSKEWGTDPKGITTGGYGLHLTPRDLAKIGLLYLRQGKWDGNQVIPAQWVASSLTKQVAVGKDQNYGSQDRDYGYLWSLFPEQKYAAALGLGGQDLYLVPDKDMIIVFTGGLRFDQDTYLPGLVDNWILPAVQSENRLPANPAVNNRLAALIQQAAQPSKPIPHLPEIANQISGKTFRLEPNVNQWQEISLNFAPGSDTAALKVDATTANVGLDNVFRITRDPGPGSDPLVLKGFWDGGDTFVIEGAQLGETGQVQLRIRFVSDGIDLNLIDEMYGSEILSTHGKPTE